MATFQSRPQILEYGVFPSWSSVVRKNKLQPVDACSTNHVKIGESSEAFYRSSTRERREESLPVLLEFE